MRRIVEIAGVILTLSLARLLMQVPNLEPIGAAALFGGALIGAKRLKFILPLAALFLGDLIIAAIQPAYVEHLFSGTFFAIYGAFVLTVLIGDRVIGKKPGVLKVVNGAILSSVAFFVITNFAAWLDPVHSIYPKTFMGLMECYIAGLAFFDQSLFGNFFLNSLVGNLGFSLLVFSLYKAYETRFSTNETIA